MIALLLLARETRAGASSFSHSETQAAPCSEAVVQEFEKRVREYVALRNQLAREIQGSHSSSSPEAIEAFRTSLATAIRRTRSQARAGDLFTPDFQACIAVQFREVLEDAGGCDVRAQLLVGMPMFPELRAGAPYPEDPHGLVPARLLIHLPLLPYEVAYRAANGALVLTDIAGIAVDSMPISALHDLETSSSDCAGSSKQP
jgi:hypothetical protein